MLSMFTIWPQNPSLCEQVLLFTRLEKVFSSFPNFLPDQLEFNQTQSGSQTYFKTAETHITPIIKQGQELFKPKSLLSGLDL